MYGYDHEYEFLGGWIYDALTKQEFTDWIEKVNEHDFLNNKHRTVFRLLAKQHAAGGTIDDRMVKEIGSSVLQHYTKATSPANIPFHFRFIKADARDSDLSTLLTKANDMIRRDGADATKVIDFLEVGINKLHGEIEQHAIRQAHEFMTDVLKDMDTPDAVRPLFTGIMPVDEHTNGMGRGTLTVIAARTSVGKTAMGMQIADYNACRGRNVFYVSLEMSGKELVIRNIANETGIDSKLIAGIEGVPNDADKKQVQAVRDEYYARHLQILASPAYSVTIKEIRSKALLLHAEKPLDLVVIDYVGLVKPLDHSQQRAEQIGDITKRMKSLASELDVPVLTLSQINRAGVDEPNLQHLADSDQIARDSDNIWILHRPSLEEPATTLFIRKARGGQVGSVSLEMKAPTTKFGSPSIESMPNYSSDFAEYADGIRVIDS